MEMFVFPCLITINYMVSVFAIHLDVWMFWNVPKSFLAFIVGIFRYFKAVSNVVTVYVYSGTGVVAVVVGICLFLITSYIQICCYW